MLKRPHEHITNEKGNFISDFKLSSCGEYLFTLKKRGRLQVYPAYKTSFYDPVEPIADLNFSKESILHDAYTLEICSKDDGSGFKVFVATDSECKRSSIFTFEFLKEGYSLVQNGCLDISSGKYGSFMKGLTAFRPN